MSVRKSKVIAQLRWNKDFKGLIAVNMYPKAHKTCRFPVLTIEQTSAIESGIATIYCELEDPRKYREAVALVCAAKLVLCGVNPGTILESWE